KFVRLVSSGCSALMLSVLSTTGSKSVFVGGTRAHSVCSTFCRPEIFMRNTTGNDGTARGPRRSGGVGLFAVPRRAGLVADPSKAWVLDAHTAQVLSNTPIGVLVQALCRFVEPAIAAQQSDMANGDSCRSV